VLNVKEAMYARQFWSILLLLCSCIVAQEVTPLQKLKDRDVNNRLGWPASIDDSNKCTLPGITCTGNQVIRLEAPGQQIVASIPTEISYLSSLQVLDLSHNLFTGKVPTELGLLAQLQSIILNDNGFSSTIPTNIGGLSNLIQLDLSSNGLTGKLPTNFGNLNTLTLLNVSNNGLTLRIPTEFGRMSSLTNFDGRNNQLSGTIPTQLAQLSTLNLLLSNNCLSGALAPSTYFNIDATCNLFTIQDCDATQCQPSCYTNCGMSPPPSPSTSTSTGGSGLTPTPSGTPLASTTSTPTPTVVPQVAACKINQQILPACTLTQDLHLSIESSIELNGLNPIIVSPGSCLYLAGELQLNLDSEQEQVTLVDGCFEGQFSSSVVSVTDQVQKCVDVTYQESPTTLVALLNFEECNRPPFPIWAIILIVVIVVSSLATIPISFWYSKKKKKKAKIEKRKKEYLEMISPDLSDVIKLETTAGFRSSASGIPILDGTKITNNDTDTLEEA